jgi:hypothetical protein
MTQHFFHEKKTTFFVPNIWLQCQLIVCPQICICLARQWCIRTYMYGIDIEKIHFKALKHWKNTEKHRKIWQWHWKNIENENKIENIKKYDIDIEKNFTIDNFAHLGKTANVAHFKIILQWVRSYFYF